MAKKKYIYKSSVDGKIVTKEFAKDNPTITYRDDVTHEHEKRKTFFERLVQEQEELLEKLTKLNEFLVSEKVSEIDLVQHNLLKTQVRHMADYNSVLETRIELLKAKI